jgi:hypothetical protein
VHDAAGKSPVAQEDLDLGRAASGGVLHGQRTRHGLGAAAGVEGQIGVQGFGTNSPAFTGGRDGNQQSHETAPSLKFLFS